MKLENTKQFLTYHETNVAMDYRRMPIEITYVGPGHWFDIPDHYMRIEHGWPSKKSLKEGLEALTNCWEKTLHR